MGGRHSPTAIKHDSLYGIDESVVVAWRERTYGFHVTLRHTVEMYTLVPVDVHKRSI
jgi:hypothetical protein